MSYMKLHQVEWSYLHSYEGKPAELRGPGYLFQNCFAFRLPPSKGTILSKIFPPPLENFCQFLRGT